MNELVKEVSYRIHTYETDTQGYLRIPALFNYLQDIASQHAVSLHFGKEDLEKKNRFWVLSRIYCKLDKLPEWNDEILIRTWPRGIEKIFALRDYEISDSTGDRIGGATSSWLMLNIENRRPVRPDNLFEILNGDTPERASLGRNAGKLPPVEDWQYKSSPIPVKHSDLDLNLHVNNVSYLQWALDSYPLDFIMSHRLKTAELNFLSESLPGDEVYVLAGESEENLFDHSITRKADGRELCRLRVEWIS